MSESPATGAREPGRPTLSVVIPSWRDADQLARLIPAIAGLALHEIIIVDASADAATEQLALQHGAVLLKCSAPNRGAQMNVGAMFASGDVLLFQHADTELTAAHLSALRAAGENREIIGGAFYRKFDRRHPLLQPFEGVARFLTRSGGTLYGDQSIFVRRETFLQLRGFAKIPLMEDMEFSKRLRAAGKIAVLDPPILSSSRHHQRQGAWRRTLQNGLFIVLYKCGVSPVRLHEWYYRGAANPATAEPLRS